MAEVSKSDEKSEVQAKLSPISCIVVGMAGSGKTSLMRALVLSLHKRQIPRYVVNLDPACDKCQFGPNIDIRDSVNYHEVMKQYSLGPNGAIMTSLNLFATKFEEVLQLIEKRQPIPKFVLFDTPGQIEVFTWSASGAIITEALGVTFPTVIVYVVDVPRSVENPSTFMANMLYAISILYKTGLPLVLALSKTDVMSERTIIEWMEDEEKFQEALKSDSSYSSDLLSSMALTLEEFYKTLHAVGVSSVSGNGITELFEAIEKSVDVYNKTFKLDVEERKAENEKKEKERQKESFDKLQSTEKQIESEEKELIEGERITLEDEKTNL